MIRVQGKGTGGKLDVRLPALDPGLQQTIAAALQDTPRLERVDPGVMVACGIPLTDAALAAAGRAARDALRPVLGQGEWAGWLSVARVQVDQDTAAACLQARQ